MSTPEFPERIWLIDHEKDDRRIIGWTPERPPEEDDDAVEYVRADQLAEARALVEADAEEDADVPLAELIQGHFDAYEAEIARLRAEGRREGLRAAEAEIMRSVKETRGEIKSAASGRWKTFKECELDGLKIAHAIVRAHIEQAEGGAA